MKDRIKKIRKESGLTQEKFAERLGLKRNTIATYETGKSEPMDNIIVSMCREFNINEEWLRYGKEPMKADADMEFADICFKIGIKDPKARQVIINYWKLSEDDRKLFWEFIEKLTKAEE